MSVLACTDPPETDGGTVVQPPPEVKTLNPLGDAKATPWVQQVWFTADPGERVDYFTLTTEGSPLPIVALSKPDGSKRTVLIAGPGTWQLVGTRLSVGARDSASGLSADQGWRATVTGGEEGRPVLLTVTNLSGATGRVQAVQDLPGRKLVHPSVGPGGSAVYVEEDGDLGGVYRVQLPTGPTTRIVPEPAGSMPLAWPFADGAERIAYVDETDGARVIVAFPALSPPLPAVAAFETAGVPPRVVPVVDDGTGTLLRAKPCDGVVEQAIDAAAAGGTVTIGPVRSTESLSCGEGCVALLVPSPSGAPRIVTSMQRARGAWEVWFDVSVGLLQGLYAAPDDPALVPIDTCTPPLPPETWVVTPLVRGGASDKITWLDVSGNDLLVQGRSKGQGARWVLFDPTQDAPLVRALLQEPAMPDRPATSSDGRVTARVVDGAIVLETSTSPVTVVDADPARSLGALAYDAAQRVWFVDEGANPGLWYVSVSDSQLHRAVGWKGVTAPRELHWDGDAGIGFVRGNTAWFARPAETADRDAWNAGPVSLAQVEPVWLPVHYRDGRLERCQSGDVVRVGVDRDGGYVAWGKVRVPAHAAASRGGIVSILGNDGGVPVVLVELRTDGETVRGLARGLPVSQSAWQWMPEASAAALPEGGPCQRPGTR